MLMRLPSCFIGTTHPTPIHTNACNQGQSKGLAPLITRWSVPYCFAGWNQFEPRPFNFARTLQRMHMAEP